MFINSFNKIIVTTNLYYFDLFRVLIKKWKKY